jgi:hypothetical protein
MDEQNWRVFVNCRMDPVSGAWEMTKRPIVPMKA